MRTILAPAVIAMVAGSALAAPTIPASQAAAVIKCPQGTTATQDGNRLLCRANFVCDTGYEAIAVNGGGITCFKRENFVAAADCNNCGLGVHVQTARSGKDTCTPPIGKADASKLACCKGATRWQDLNGQLDVCGFFAAPRPQ